MDITQHKPVSAPKNLSVKPLATGRPSHSTSLAVVRISGGGLITLLGLVLFLLGVPTFSSLFVVVPVALAGAVLSLSGVIPVLRKPLEGFTNAVQLWASAASRQAVDDDDEYELYDAYHDAQERMYRQLKNDARLSLTAVDKVKMMLHRPVSITVPDYSVPQCFEDTDNYKSLHDQIRHAERDLGYRVSDYDQTRYQNMSADLQAMRAKLDNARARWEEDVQLHSRSGHSELRFTGKGFEWVSWQESSPASVWLDAVDHAVAL